MTMTAPKETTHSEYPHIDSIWKRETEGPRKGHIIEGAFAAPEFAYLARNTWIGTEKVDGTNIRVMWDGNAITFGGKTNSAQIPAFLVKRLMDLFLPQAAVFAEKFGVNPVCLYGEGYGAKIQKVGGNYNPNGVDFVLFDVRTRGWWLQRDDLEDIAAAFIIGIVPIIFQGTLREACEMTAAGFKSQWGNFTAEGLVLKPEAELLKRNGSRIITKIKVKDY